MLQFNALIKVWCGTTSDTLPLPPSSNACAMEKAQAFHAAQLIARLKVLVAYRTFSSLSARLNAIFLCSNALHHPAWSEARSTRTRSFSLRRSRAAGSAGDDVGCCGRGNWRRGGGAGCHSCCYALVDVPFANRFSRWHFVAADRAFVFFSDLPSRRWRWSRGGRRNWCRKCGSRIW